MTTPAIAGRAYVLGDNVDTDQIIPAQYLTFNPALPEEYRLPLMMRYLTGADYETIQLQMGLTNGALRGLLRLLRGCAGFESHRRVTV